MTWATAYFCQNFPERSVQRVVPFGPGGTTDIMARLLQDELAKSLGDKASVVVVNTAGAGGLIGMANVARAKADGYLIAMTTVDPQTIGLPTDVRNKLEAACKTAVNSTAYKARAQAANNPLEWRTGEQFKAFALAEHERFKRVVAQHNLIEK